MIRGEVVFRPARLHRAPNIQAEKGGFIPIFEIVEGTTIHFEKQGVKEWLQLTGKYEGWFVATKYPNEAYILSGGRLGQVITRVETPPKPVIYATCKSELEMHGMSRPEWNVKDKRPRVPYEKIIRGLPATIPIHPIKGGNLYCRLDRNDNRGHKFIKSLLKKAAPNFTDTQIDKAYTHLTQTDRAFTNYDRNRYQMLGCARMSVRLVDPVPVKAYGELCFLIRMINFTNFNEADYLAMPLPNPFVMLAMNSVKGDGLEHFPQLDGRPVPWPLMSDTGMGLLPAVWVSKVWPEGSPFPAFSLV